MNGEPELAEAGSYPTAAEGFEHGLVLLAMGLPYWLQPPAPLESSAPSPSPHEVGMEIGDDDRNASRSAATPPPFTGTTADRTPAGRYRLMVEAPYAEEARGELARYDRESAGWPPRPLVWTSPRRRGLLVTPLLWAIAVIAVFNLQGRVAAFGDRRLALDPRAIFGRGQVWRAFTALFLHADIAHLTSNLAFGVFTFAAVLATFGIGRGWLLLGFSSVAGNLAAAALHFSGAYLSLGASTAIFAGLGLLTGRAARILRRAPAPRRWSALLTPIASGATLLALFGAGGMEVDVVAHLTGFGCGLLVGAAAPGRLPERVA